MRLLLFLAGKKWRTNNGSSSRAIEGNGEKAREGERPVREAGEACENPICKLARIRAWLCSHVSTVRVGEN